MTDSPETPLADVVARLDAAAIPYMVVGSFASAIHGEPRTTRDLDIVIDPTARQLDELVASFDPDRYYVDAEVARDALRRRTMFNVIDISTAWKIDLIIRQDRAFSVEELARRHAVFMLGTTVATATAEDTIIAKLEWAKRSASQRQLVDVAGILRVRGADLDARHIARWVAELDLDEVWQAAQALAR